MAISVKPYGKYSSRAEYMREYYKTPRGRIKVKEACARYWRSRVGTMVNGKRVTLSFPNKPPKPEVCPLCRKSTRAKGFHHWVDGSQLRGMWLCPYCHAAAERADCGFLGKYLELRRMIDMEFLDVAEGSDVPEELEKGRVGKMINGKLTWFQAPFKRPKPKACELCSQPAFLGYHHWSEPWESKGLWVCAYCHAFAELVDRGLVRKYLDMKEAS